MIIAIDFDGTLCDHRFPDIGDEAPHAFDWLKKFQAAGAKLILWTMRSDGREGEGKENGPVLTQAVEWCRERGIEFWGINANPEQHWSKSPKAYAHLYIDDAAYGCPLRDHVRDGSRPIVHWEIIGPVVMRIIEEHKAPPIHIDRKVADTVFSEPNKCCYLDDDGKQCDQQATTWIGTQGIDDYTHSCDAHAEELTREGDKVWPLDIGNIPINVVETACP